MFHLSKTKIAYIDVSTWNQLSLAYFITIGLLTSKLNTKRRAKFWSVADIFHIFDRCIVEVHEGAIQNQSTMYQRCSAMLSRNVVFFFYHQLLHVVALPRRIHNLAFYMLCDDLHTAGYLALSGQFTPALTPTYCVKHHGGCWHNSSTLQDGEMSSAFHSQMGICG